MSELDPTVPPIPQPPAYATHRPHRGTLVLVLGILSLVCCGFPVGIVAWVLGHADLKAMDRGEIDPSGRSLTQAGKICGIISVVLSVLGLICTIAWMVFAAIVSNS